MLTPELHSQPWGTASSSDTIEREQPDVVVVGGGPVGLTIAVYLGRLGCRVHVHEARPREVMERDARRISVDLSTRGMRVLQELGALASLPMATMFGRRMHPPGAPSWTLPFASGGGRLDIRTTDRAALRASLLAVAERHPRVRVLHGSRRLPASRRFVSGHALWDYGSSPVVIGCDGGRSGVRRDLEDDAHVRTTEQQLGWELVPLELTVPSLCPEQFHMFSRNGCLLVLQPHPSGSFTGAVVAPSGVLATLADDEPVREWLEALPRLADHSASLGSQIARGPRVPLSERRTSTWAVQRTLLLGDAAHGMSPFLGQGLNASLESCRVLSQLVTEHGLRGALHRFEAERRPDIEAITMLSARNYPELTMPEMAAARRREELEQLRDPTFVSLHQRVCFSHMPYREIVAMEGAVCSVVP